MTVTIGDLSQSFILRRSGVELRDTLARLTEEMASGRTSDLAETLGGDFSAYASIRRSRATIEAHDRSARDTALVAETMQTALGAVQRIVSGTGPNLLSISSTNDFYLIGAASLDARGHMASVIETLNVRAADRAVFAGQDVDGRALADAGTILSAVTAAAAGATTAEDVRDAVWAWFDTPGGGFETLGYLGDADPLGARRISERASVTLDVTGAAPELREVLKGLALAALVAENMPPGDPAAQAALTRMAGDQLLDAEAGVIALRAGIGAVEARIDQVRAENGAELSAMQIAETELVGVDPFETASALTNAETRLQALYTITSRLSNLSLVNYLG